MKRNKIIVFIIISLVLIGVGCLFLTRLLDKKGSSVAMVENRDYSVIWHGVAYEGSYSGNIKNGYPSGTGSFNGIAYIDDEEYDTISYAGKWKNGKFNGLGELKQNSGKTTYKGEFKKGCLNGCIELYQEGVAGHHQVEYSMDVPRGVSFLYDEKEQIQDYDCYFKGISVKQICETAQEISYEKLLYENETYRNHRIKLKCKVQEIYQKKQDSKNIYWFVKVADKDDHKYILQYSFNHKADATTYMPELDVKQEIEVYGFCRELMAYETEVNKYPSVEALCISGMEHQILQGTSLKMSYTNFINYPNFYQDSEIQLKGEISGMYDTTSEYIYFLMESADYSENRQNLYVCYLENTDENVAVLSAATDNITVYGTMNLTKNLNKVSKKSTSNDLVSVPCVEVTEIITK